MLQPKTLEERIEEAIVARFFEPTWIVTPHMVSDPQTGLMHTEPAMTQIPSEMSTVAQAIYNKARAEIVRKVLEQLDIDALVAQWASKIAEDVVKQLQTAPNNGWSPQPNKTERQKMLDKVYEAVAEEFGRQCVEHIKNTGGLKAVLEA